MEVAITSRSYDLSIRARINLTDRLLGDARRLVRHTAVLEDDMRAVMAASASIIRHSRYLAPPRITGAGADDAGLVTAVLADGAVMCADCIARKTGIPGIEIPSIMARISTYVRVETRDLRCSVCLTTRKVYRIVVGEGDGFKTLAEMMTTRILRFLHEHPSKVFCARCISEALFNGRDIDMVMRRVEARGIKRYHAECSECRSPRLVAGVVAN